MTNLIEFTWPVRVYYEDTDAGGVVYYANYLKYLERARTEYLRALGFEQDQLKQKDGIIFAVHSLTIKYRKPAIFNDALTVTAEVLDQGNARLTFKQMITRKNDNTLICSADVTIACLDAIKFTPARIPARVQEVVRGS
ncbi:MAG: tol-pal system-associated acyl-CoA thioesterase [Gammaproteobacteria bacterium]|nr:tol-pal system-associated acyl-CoA thioesterase [Gammaproteobacteria bacterium]